MAKYSFNRPVQKNGKLTDYAKMLLELHEDGAIEIVETRRRQKYMTYQHMLEFGLIDSIKQHGSRRHQYELTQSGLYLVNQILRTQRTGVTKELIKELKKVKPADVIAHLKLQLKEAEANLAKEREDSESTKLEKHRVSITLSEKVKIKESYRGPFLSLAKFPLHIFRIAEDGLAKCAISNSGSELTFNIHFKYLEPINGSTEKEMFKAL